MTGNGRTSGNGTPRRWASLIATAQPNNGRDLVWPGATHYERDQQKTLLGGPAGTAGGVIGTAIPLPAPAAVDDPVMTPEERMQAAIEELQAADSVAIPSVKRWRI